MRTWEAYADGAEAAEALARELGVPLEKKDPPVLSTPGYERAVRDLLRALARTAGPADREAVRELAKKLDRDWTSMSAAERERVIVSASRALLGVPEIVIGPVVRSIGEQMARIVRIAKRDVGRVYRLEINPTFTAKDKKIIRAAAESQGNYITDRYSERARAVEQKVRDVVSKGIERGLGRQDIGAVLRAEVIGPALRTSEAYWETLASIHIGRARSIGQIGGFEDAGIETFQVEAVLDEVTTDVCRFMHGKTFSVAKARAIFESVEASDDPKGIEKLQPWVRTGRSKEGDRVLFVDRGERRSVIANVRESGVGTSDKIGSYDAKRDDAALQKMGISTPPYHARCRTTVVPVF